RGAAMSQRGTRGSPPPRLSLLKCSRGARAAAAARASRPRHHFAEPAAADVLTADLAVTIAADCKVELAGPPLPPHLCYLSLRAPHWPSTRQALIFHSPESWSSLQATATFWGPFRGRGAFAAGLKGPASGHGGSGRPVAGSMGTGAATG